MSIVKSAILGLAAAVLCSGAASAQLEYYEDYEVSDAVWNVTTVKVDANMGDYYLEGLKQTWVAANEVSKKLGHIDDYMILGSDLPQSGDFNMLLIVKFAETEDLAPNKKRYEEFMKAWGDAAVDDSRKTSMELYPKVRTITGEYLMREVLMK
ncbi:MAG: hypothetical protein AAGJ09_10815 [Pseudomonadota bacterium]